MYQFHETRGFVDYNLTEMLTIYVRIYEYCSVILLGVNVQ